MRRLRLATSVLFTVALLLGSIARAEQGPIIPREILFGNPERANPQLSPDATRLAWLAPDPKGVLQVWVKTLGKSDDKMVTADKKRGIRSYFWARDNKTLLYLQDNDGDENFHLYGVDLTNGNVRDYTPIHGTRAQVVEVAREMPDQILVGLNARDRRLFDVYRLTLSTGALVLDTENPGDVSSWDSDARENVLMATATTPDGGTELRVRDTPQSPWRSWMKASADENLGVVTLSPDGKSAIIESSLGSNTVRVIEKNIATGSERVIGYSDAVDAGIVVVNPATRAVEAISFEPGRRTWKVIDPAVKADFEGIAKLHDGDFAIVNRDTADRNWLVGFTSDRGPTRWYTWDREAKKGSFLFTAQPKLEGLQLSEMKAVTIKTRDGFDMNAYLTLPAGLEPKKLPMVLLVHGGPWGRDTWGYRSTVQWLANRGYAVLQPNFRASTGFGKRWLNAGDRQWGLKMHDDLIDAANWAVKQGYVDPKRIAVMGGSYGGYATLAALTFTPEFFSCGVDIVGPSNIKTLIAAIPPYWKTIRATFDKRMGNIDDPKDAELIRAASPLFKADKIVRPLLIGQGYNDPRVNRNESEQIVDAITKNNGSVTYVVYTDEGHGFARPENNLDFNARTENFLAQCLGGRAEPMFAGERYPGSSAVVKVIQNGKLVSAAPATPASGGAR